MTTQAHDSPSNDVQTATIYMQHLEIHPEQAQQTREDIAASSAGVRAAYAQIVKAKQHPGFENKGNMRSLAVNKPGVHSGTTGTVVETFAANAASSVDHGDRPSVSRFASNDVGTSGFSTPLDDVDFGRGGSSQDIDRSFDDNSPDIGGSEGHFPNAVFRSAQGLTGAAFTGLKKSSFTPL